MKKIKAINGYTIYQATARDVSKYNVEEGDFVLYFSSDIRDYGLAFSDIDYIACSIEEAEAFATGTNYAIAKEIVEETTTAASFEEILEVEAKLDSGMTREEIEESDDDESEMVKYTVTTPYKLRLACIRNNWFTEGTNSQYDKLFYANEHGAPIEEIATIIWLCSDTEATCRRDILEELKLWQTDYLMDIADEMQARGERAADEVYCGYFD